jgi:type 1 fimbria pilin
MTILRLLTTCILSCLLPVVAYAECYNEGPPYAGTMWARANLELSGNIAADTYLGSFDFERDGGTARVGVCPPGSTVALYTTHGESGGIRATFYKTIDGRPTYHLLNLGPRNYAYAIEELTTGIFHESTGPLSPREGDLTTPSARLHLYAAVDNPENIKANGATVGALLIRKYEPGYTKVGFTYVLRLYATNTTSCSVTNQNLYIRLPDIPINNFPSTGFSQSQASAEDEITVNCSGPMSGTLRINANNGTTTHDGREIVLKTRNEGEGKNAAGFGFVLSAPNNVNGYLADNETVSLGSLNQGDQSIPIKAEYYRHGDYIKAGEMEASASFVIEFN